MNRNMLRNHLAAQVSYHDAKPMHLLNQFTCYKTKPRCNGHTWINKPPCCTTIQTLINKPWVKSLMHQFINSKSQPTTIEQNIKPDIAQQRLTIEAQGNGPCDWPAAEQSHTKSDNNPPLPNPTISYHLHHTSPAKPMHMNNSASKPSSHHELWATSLSIQEALPWFNHGTKTDIKSKLHLSHLILQTICILSYEQHHKVINHKPTATDLKLNPKSHKPNKPIDMQWSFLTCTSLQHKICYYLTQSLNHAIKGKVQHMITARQNTKRLNSEALQWFTYSA